MAPVKDTYQFGPGMSGQWKTDYNPCHETRQGVFMDWTMESLI